VATPRAGDDFASKGQGQGQGRAKPSTAARDSEVDERPIDSKPRNRGRGRKRKATDADAGLAEEAGGLDEGSESTSDETGTASNGTGAAAMQAALEAEDAAVVSSLSSSNPPSRKKVKNSAGKATDVPLAVDPTLSLADIAGRLASRRGAKEGNANAKGALGEDLEEEEEDDDEDDDDIFDSAPDMSLARSMGPRAVSLYSARAMLTGTGTGSGPGTAGGTGAAGNGKRQSRVFRHSMAGGTSIPAHLGSSSLEDAQAELARSVAAGVGLHAVEGLDAAGRTDARPSVQGKAMAMGRGGALGRRRRQSAAGAGAGAGGPLARSDSVNSGVHHRGRGKAASGEIAGGASASASQQSLASDLD